MKRQHTGLCTTQEWAKLRLQSTPADNNLFFFFHIFLSWFLFFIPCHCDHQNVILSLQSPPDVFFFFPSFRWYWRCTSAMGNRLWLRYPSPLRRRAGMSSSSVKSPARVAATWLRSGEATVRSCLRERTRGCQEDEVTLNSTMTEFDTSLTSRRITFYVKTSSSLKKESWAGLCMSTRVNLNYGEARNKAKVSHFRECKSHSHSDQI